MAKHQSSQDNGDIAMALRCPVEEQRIVLEHVARIHELTNDPDIVDALLEGAAQYAEGEVEPLNRIATRWAPNGRPKASPCRRGFHEAYRQFVEGGWGTISAPEGSGGQGLPLTLGAR
jgi:alkylation response protein AidB-like acyl-CoA dehydrogenase